MTFDFKLVVFIYSDLTLFSIKHRTSVVEHNEMNCRLINTSHK